MQVILKKGPYFNYGDRFYVDFKYDNNEEAIKMRNNFEEDLIPTYGANSSRVTEEKDYLMPYLVDENGNFTTDENAQIVGGTNIPEDLLPEFMKRFVEEDKATVKIGTEEIKEEFDKEQFDEMVSKIGFEIAVQRGPYFDYGNKIFATFKYSNQRQQEKVRKYFNEVLLPEYGANSAEATRGEEYMMPFLVDENGNVTTDENAKIIGGTSVPRNIMEFFFTNMIDDLDISDTTFLFEDKRVSGDFNYSNWEKNPEEHEASKKWDICFSEFDELSRQDGVEKIPEWIEEGKKYIYPEKYRAWEDRVRGIDSKVYLFRIREVENTLRIMKLLEIGSNQAKEETKDYLSHYDRESSLWSILEFVKTGPEFVEENYPRELSDSTKEFIQQKKAENMILAEKYGQAQTSASQTNPKK